MQSFLPSNVAMITYSLDGDSLVGYVRLMHGRDSLFVPDGPFSAIMSASPARQRNINFLTFGPKHRTISPDFCKPSIIYLPTNDSFLHDVQPFAFQCPRFVRLFVSTRAVKLIFRFQCRSPSMSDASNFTFESSCLPLFSFWGLFGTGASMVLW